MISEVGDGLRLCANVADCVIVEGGDNARQNSLLCRVAGRLQSPHHQFTGQLAHRPQLDQLSEQSADRHPAVAAVAAGAVRLQRS